MVWNRAVLAKTSAITFLASGPSYGRLLMIATMSNKQLVKDMGKQIARFN